MSALTIEEAIKRYNRRLYNQKLRDDIAARFSGNLNYYIKKTSDAINAGESEEYLKNITNAFLKSTFYNNEIYEINTIQRVDSSIKVNGSIRVLIENKNPKNITEMVTANNVNVKALHELIFYYLSVTRDTSGEKVKRISDIEIRRVMITDTIHWVIIDANEIEKIVDGYLEKHYYKYINKQLIYSNKAEKFYDDIKQYLNAIRINDKLPYVFFNISDYTSDKKSTYLYKIFYKNFLLKENARYEESTHVLKEKFYQELLYIMGFKEKTGKTSKTIEIDFTIKNSLSNQVFNILKNDKEYDDLSCIEKTFELVIIWMNRLLFIKLFEGQLMSFNGDSKDYRILDIDKITNFQELQDLFFEVLGRREREDTPFFLRFKEIPYLNSSLFERYEVERQDVNINSIKNYPVQKKKNSVIDNSNEKEKPLLEYIIEFLNSYNFSSEIGKNNTIVRGRDIIDSSVLGLIFEKLNGYRDGSFYTPSIITEYMCMKSIESTIIDLINKKKMWRCKDLFEIKEKIGSSLTEKREIDNIINTVKICDISVGSGHFLVSALNRLIAIKKQLGVLFKYKKDELLSEFEIDIVDDVLQVFDGQGNVFSYDKNNALFQSIQETLFNEKRTIIENCLFGVDINPKATAICQLRLWIELLKNAYYKNGIMETLPNIDINIKVGNSLISQLSFDIGKKIGSNNIEFEKSTVKKIKEYKKLVHDYKGTSDKKIKNNILKQIYYIKDDLHSSYSQASFNAKGVIDYGEDISVYKGAFEWAIEFPELLNEKGVFLGFDCIIGNPPYGLINKKQNQNTSISVSEKLYSYYNNTPLYFYARGGVINIYRLFICRCFSLLRMDGRCCLIFPLAFMGDSTNSMLRRFIMENTRIDFLEAFPERDNANTRVFKEVKMSVCILGATKTKVDSSYKFGVRINRDKYVDDNNSVMYISYNEIDVIDGEKHSIPIIQEHELPIFLKMSKDCKRMSEYSKCYTGEVDMSLDKKYITTSDKDALMLRGAQVQKYYTTNDISQGEIFYLRDESFLQNNRGERSEHHNRKRIVMQGITGINEKWRLKMTMINPPYFCANSVNYLIPPVDNDLDYFLLGVLNSKLINWYFSKQSTNSNVNGYEVDGIPIKEGTKAQQLEVISAVKKVLNNPEDVGEIQKIDHVIYDIYGITDYEIPIIED